MIGICEKRSNLFRNDAEETWIQEIKRDKWMGATMHSSGSTLESTNRFLKANYAREKPKREKRFMRL